MQRHTFRAMGTDIELLLDAEQSAESELALARAETEFERLEALLSRFHPDSELSALNRSGSLVAGEELVEVTRLALAARERTGGRFDPTVHDALVAAGYDRTFEEVAPDGEAGTPRPCGGRVQVDAETGLIELEAGFRLDLGGIAKGYTVDRACDVLAEAGPCLVNAGGDLACRGRLWPVGVETADGPITLGLEHGAIATSGRDRRVWQRDGREAHHLIDPATGAPAETELVRATVVAETAAEAEVLAKAAFLGGESEAELLGVPCVLVTADGRTVIAGGLS